MCIMKYIFCSATVVGSIKDTGHVDSQSTDDIFTRCGGTNGNVGHWVWQFHCGTIWEHFDPGELRSGFSSCSAVENGRGRWEDVHIYWACKQSDWHCIGKIKAKHFSFWLSTSKWPCPPGYKSKKSLLCAILAVAFFTIHGKASVNCNYVWWLCGARTTY